MFSFLNKFFKYFFLLIIIGGAFGVDASTTNGTIDLVNHSALLCQDDACLTTSRINFLTTKGREVHVTNSVLTGDIWSEQMGWINLDPSKAGVTNDNGVLSGYAWGENSGWINFNPSKGGVSINNTGEFTGHAWAQNYGWIKFDCGVTDACVKTDWRPSSGGGGGGGSGGFGGGEQTFCQLYPSDPSCQTIPFCTLYPNNPSCLNPNFCDLNPTSPNCQTPPDFCATNPTDPSCLTPNFCTQNPNDPSCIITTPPDPPCIGFNCSGTTGGGTGGGAGGGGITNGDDIFTIINDIINFFNIPIVNISAKIIAGLGALAGIFFGIINTAFAGPLAFSEIFMTPIRLWSLLLAGLGFKKRQVPWGTVYDSITKQPLDPAYVVLTDLDGREIATSITDLDGRYGFLVPAGNYRLKAHKTNYEFPSKKLFNRTRDELYSDLYFNEIITILKDGEVITKNIPMDSVNFDWNEFAKKDQKLMKFFSSRDVWKTKMVNGLFNLGFIFTIILVLIFPSTYNIIVLAFYFLVIILKKTILIPRAYGWVKNKGNNAPLSFAIMRFFFAESGYEVTHKITDMTGKYYCLIPNGKYYTKIETKNKDKSYSLVHTSQLIEVNNGHINKKFEV